MTNGGKEHLSLSDPKVAALIERQNDEELKQLLRASITETRELRAEIEALKATAGADDEE